MPRISPTSRERSSAETTAWPISPVGPVTATVSGRALRARGAGAMHRFYRIPKTGEADGESRRLRCVAMSGADLGTAASVFLASAVECVEALTIVLAVGSTRSWRSAFGGVATALVA